jgi:hypothetical protein
MLALDPEWSLKDRIPVKFNTHVPVSASAIQEHVSYALGLGLPEADREPIRTLHIIANGPSAAEFDFGADGDTLALNGALKLFTDRGLAPTYWAACDPQELVRDFLWTAPVPTKYLVASRCHPSIFRALRGYDVRLWHIEEDGVETPSPAIYRGSTITLCAMTLMRRLGYRHFEIHGWDGCYDGLRHHASAKPLKAVPDDAIHFEFQHQAEDGELIQGRKFITTTAWSLEAQEAVIQLQLADYSYNIHGPGMIAEMVRAHVRRPA